MIQKYELHFENSTSEHIEGVFVTYKDYKKLQTELENEQKASRTYRTALSNIGAQSIIADNVESMAYVAKAAISLGLRRLVL